MNLEVECKKRGFLSEIAKLQDSWMPSFDVSSVSGFLELN
jgi:hypothetical protein